VGKRNQQNKGDKMAKQLSSQAQVAKILKQKAKELGLEARSYSQSFSGGDSVTIKILSGTDDSYAKLKEYSRQYQYGHFDGMIDLYEISNRRDDIPQTKYLFVNDERLEKIIDDNYQGPKNSFYSLRFTENDENVGQYKFFQRLREIAGENWAYYAADMIRDIDSKGVVGYLLQGWDLKIYKQS
tara:strand:+ start:14353 stop:14904 length:552 start_codon:yes stop_codon:yes gene_type:complete